MWQKEKDQQRKEPMTKARKALDWALSCLIRMPVFAIFTTAALFVVVIIVALISPQNVEYVLRFLG